MGDCCVCGSRLEVSRLKCVSSACEGSKCGECFSLLLFWKGFVLGYAVKSIIIHCFPTALCNDKQPKDIFLHNPNFTPVNKQKNVVFKIHNRMPIALGTDAPVQHLNNSYEPSSGVTDRVRCHLETFPDINQFEDETRQMQVQPVSSGDDEAMLTKSKWQVHINSQTPNLLADIKRDVSSGIREPMTEGSTFIPTALELK